MPKLQSITTEKIFLPSTENETDESDKGYVVIKDRLLLGDTASLQEVDNDTDRAYQLVVNAISEWNFTDDSDQPAAVTIENIKLLPNADQQFLIEKIASIAQESFQGLTNQENLTSSVSSLVATEIPKITPPTS